MYELAIIPRFKRSKQKLRLLNYPTLDIVFVLKHGHKKKVLEKLGYLCYKTHKAKINYIRILYILYNYSYVNISKDFGHFWCTFTKLKKDSWK